MDKNMASTTFEEGVWDRELWVSSLARTDSKRTVQACFFFFDFWLDGFRVGVEH